MTQNILIVGVPLRLVEKAAERTDEFKSLVFWIRIPPLLGDMAL